MPDFSALIMVAIVAATIVLMEVGARLIAFLIARSGRKPIPIKATFLAEQSRGLKRLASGEAVRARINPVLGWDYGTGTVSSLEGLNSQGLRGTREYASSPENGSTRIAAYGDSFVYCNEVTDVDSWPGIIESRWNAEVLNCGVGGYGPDQALLRYRAEGSRYRPAVVVLGFTSVMAIRVVSRVRRFEDPRDGPWYKPRFVLDGSELRYLPSPVSSREDAERLLDHPEGIAEFGQHDFWYNPALLQSRLYEWSAAFRLFSFMSFGLRRRFLDADRIKRGRTLNPDSEAFRLLTAIFQEFVREVRAAGAAPLVLFLPGRSDVESRALDGPVTYETFRARLVELEVPLVDPVEVLAESTESHADLFSSGGHYSPRGNAIIASVVASALSLAERDSTAGRSASGGLTDA